jgi:hypothetical protein
MSDDNCELQRIRILQIIRGAGTAGVTRDQIASHGILTASVTARVNKMIRKKQIIETEFTRLTRSGVPAMIVCAPEYYSDLRARARAQIDARKVSGFEGEA